MYKPLFSITTEVLLELRESNVNNIIYIKSLDSFDNDIHNLLNHFEKQIHEINIELIHRGVVK